MSHVVAVDCRITDIDALRRACETLGLEFREGQTTYRWYGRWENDYAAEDAAYKLGIRPETYGQCRHAIAIPGDDRSYEIGVVERSDGTYALVLDFYGSNGARTAQMVGGHDFCWLLNHYQGEVQSRIARDNGWFVDRYDVSPADHSIRLHCSR